MSDLEKIFKKNPDIATRKIDNEFILVPICKTIEDVDCIYTLKDVKGRIWELIDGKRKIKKIRDNIFKEYKVTLQKLQKDVIDTVKEFKKINCVLEVSGRSKKA